MGKKDITQKSFFEDAEIFADLMNAAYFGGDEILEAKDLLPENTSLQLAEEEAICERIRDVVKKQTKDGSVFALYVLENQTKVDYGMLIRIMVEEGMAYHKQVKEIRKRNKERFGNALESDEFLCGFRRSDRLYPVYTLVLYWGEKEWDAKDSLRELVNMSGTDAQTEARLKELLPDYRIHVYDLNKENDFSAFQTSLRTVFEFYACRSDCKRMEAYMETNKEAIMGLDTESAFLLAVMLEDERLMEQLKEQRRRKEEAENERNNREEENVCKAIDDMIEKGVKRGKEEGKMEGKIESVFELLSDLGEISNSLREKISAETDAVVLSRWHKLAAKSDSLIEFEKAM